jgi:hypothetical protein
MGMLASRIKNLQVHGKLQGGKKKKSLLVDSDKDEGEDDLAVLHHAVHEKAISALHSKQKNLASGAVKKHGAFTAQAKSVGKSTQEYAEEEKDAPGKAGKRARLALLFSKLRPKKK